MKTLEKEINAIKARLSKKQVCENFGQDEVRKLENKYGYADAVREFDNWCMNYTGIAK